MQTATGRPSQIFLKQNAARYEEGIVATGHTIKPGNLLDVHTDGTIRNHGTAAGTGVAKRIATEECLLYEGKTIADSYAAGAVVSYREALPGDLIQVWLESGVNAAIDDKLESAGDGSFQALTTGQALVQCVEAVDATGGTKLCRVKVL